MVQFSKGQVIAMSIVMALTIQNPDAFVWILNVSWRNGGHLSEVHMVGLIDTFSWSCKKLCACKNVFFSVTKLPYQNTVFTYTQYNYLQKGSKYQTGPIFEWSRVV